MAFSRGPQIVNKNLIISLDAASPRSYSGTGTIWYDLSGWGNDATLSGSPSHTKGNAGYFNFVGTTFATITYQAASMNSWNTEQTIEIWCYPTTDTLRRNIWDQAYGGFGTWTMEPTGNPTNYYYGNAGGNNTPYTALTSPNFPANGWYQMVITRTTSTITWYGNGNSIASHANAYGTLAATTANIRIATGYTGEYFQGRIGIVRAYNRALTSSEILQNYLSTEKRYNPSVLV